MKKKLALIFSSVPLLLAMIFALCACSTYGKVRRKFEREGWEENETLVEQEKALLKLALGDDYKSVCKIHALNKKGSIINYVIILEFDTTKEMNEKIDESEKLKSIVKDAQKSDFVSGTCILLMYTPLGGGNEVFKSTK